MTPSFFAGLASGSKGGTVKAMIAIGAFTIAFANAGAVVELVRDPAVPPPAATKEDFRELREDVRAMRASIDSLRVYLRIKHHADVSDRDAFKKALDKLSSPNEVLTSKLADYPLPP